MTPSVELFIFFVASGLVTNIITAVVKARFFQP